MPDDGTVNFDDEVTDVRVADWEGVAELRAGQGVELGPFSEGTSYTPGISIEGEGSYLVFNGNDTKEFTYAQLRALLGFQKTINE